ncbi:putative D-aminoacylase [Dissoconium aciculare CBS 342.82]|uniref:D-aminoacylase n=1 Tax=Dissoconium aciculare CBS 342.82 TaxID=1314786 RepID=A0A6J3M6Z4_9PEZI|nr:putative D-aminoacylase [Dissoconium aciculare CBS 342.82]KAF1823289.1 putative D-aminoacylase [Dissoconium aciculare CBS 342.82]
MDVLAVKRRLEAIEPTVHKICEVAGAPGISITVSSHGEHIYSLNAGFSNLETRQPVTSATRFPVGTMAKTFTASAAGALVAEGLLKWNTPIREIIPELHTTSPTVTENLTMVDLLSHRAGLGRSNFWWQGASATPLLEKRDLLPFYNKMPISGQFREDWGYSNWGYALAGEVIERLTGKSYSQVLREKVLAPAGLNDTTFESFDPSGAANLALPYAALDDGSLHRLAHPTYNDKTIMAPALGGVSTVEDLANYCVCLLQAFKYESNANKNSAPPSIKHALMQLSGHIFIGAALREKSYAFGWYRTELPNTVLGMGWNSIYVNKMPRIVPRTHVGPLIAHGGSLPGYHTSIALLPGIESSVVACTNSIALGDVSGWVCMAIIEVLVDTQEPSDYVALAAEAAQNAKMNVKNFQAKLEANRTNGAGPREIHEYVGTYRDEKRGWSIDVRRCASSPSGMEVAFQGLDNQAWSLSHFERDTFLWLASREEQVKRGRMVTYPLVADHFKLHFQEHQNRIDRILWKHELGASEETQYLFKIT